MTETKKEDLKVDPDGMTPERICELYSSLTAWGVDINGVRERFLEDDRLYIRSLKRFADGSCLKRLDKALTDHDPASAYEAAHMIKGTTATLNLKPLYDIVCKITRGLRQDDLSTLDEDYRQLCAAYAQLCEMICQISTDFQRRKQ